MKSQEYLATVLSCRETSKGSGMFELRLKWLNHPKFEPGQFVALSPAHPASLIWRPFSAYAQDKKSVTLLIKVVGKNTRLYSQLQNGDTINISGPKGSPILIDDRAKRYLLVTGGAGVAGIRPLSEKLCKDGRNVDVLIGAFAPNQIVGVDRFKASGCRVKTITETGNGEQGLVTDLLKREIAQGAEDTVVVSCGPLRMLKEVAELTIECRQSWVLLEEILACRGNFDCKGCAIWGKDKKVKYLCRDGPAFSASWPDYDKLIMREEKIELVDTKESQPDNQSLLSVKLTGQEDGILHLRSPIMNASGSKDCYSSSSDFECLGAVVCKGIKHNEVLGNEGPRVWEVPGGLLNSIGLAGKGVERFKQEDLPVWKNYGLPVIGNIAGNSVAEYVDNSYECVKAGVDALELNVSCPNVAGMGITFGVDPQSTYEVVNAVRREIHVPIITKLTPGAGVFITDVAKAAVDAGTDILSLINTVLALDYDIDTWLPKPGYGFGGMSGPNIFHHALWNVRQVYKAQLGVPIIGVGGIHSGETAVKMFLAGANAIQVGTARFTNPNVMSEIYDYLLVYLKKYGFIDINEIVGKGKKGKGG